MAKVSRKRRLEQQRKAAVTLEQTKNQLKTAQAESIRVGHRLAAANRRLDNSVRMPDGVLQDLLTRAVREATHTISNLMARNIVDMREHSEELARMVEGGMIIRSDNQGYVSSRERLDTGDHQVTFEFPSFRWTQMLDRHRMENMMGRRGPVYMPDQPIHVMEGHRNPRPFNGMDEAETMSFETF